MAGRVLEFNVNKQRLMKNRYCDFSGIVAGSVGYLAANFHFSKEWDGCVKIATFWSSDYRQFPVFLDKNDYCIIPAEVLKGDIFFVSVLGGKKDYKIETKKVKVLQEVNRDDYC